MSVINAGTVRHRTVANLNISIKIFAKLNVLGSCVSSNLKKKNSGIVSYVKTV